MKLKILDCTLRDGGYTNNWNFGEKAITDIINKLCKSKIDITEIGFLNDKTEYVNGSSLFNSVEKADDCIKIADIPKTEKCVAMIMHNKFNCDNLSPKNNLRLSGIRYCFKKDYIDEALENCEIIRSKGYDIYLQPASLTDYSDYDILSLIDKANKMDIAAFYIVDTYGVMRRNDVIRYFYIIDKNLKKNVPIGFHSHNNLQLSFSNAQELILMHSDRDIIIDSSVLGMGRGAGNLCTELLTQYINENIENRYDLIPILEIMDEYIMPIYARHPWGYSAPYYIAAVNDCHPNYATYLMNRQALCIRDINSIIKSIPEEEKHIYSADLISGLYLNYQKHSVDDSAEIVKISKFCTEREILILAPGKSLVTRQNDIKKYICEHNPIIFAINHVPDLYGYDKVFVSNLKRFKGIDDAVSRLGEKLICTSNITTNREICVVNYSNYLNSVDSISDNAGLMLINLLIKSGVKELALAGYDGFNCAGNNYFDEKMTNGVQYEKQLQMNGAIINYFKNIRRDTEIKFITPTIYDGSGSNV